MNLWWIDGERYRQMAELMMDGWKKGHIIIDICMYKSRNLQIKEWMGKAIAGEKEREREREGSDNIYYIHQGHVHSTCTFYTKSCVHIIFCKKCRFHNFYSVHIPIPKYLYCVNTIYRSS